MLTIKYLCTGSAKEVDFVARAFAHTVKKKVFEANTGGHAKA